MSLFQPDRYFSRITAIDIKHDLIFAGYTNVLLDIDNTLRSRETGEIPRDAGIWLGRAREAGINFCLLSNNWHDNVFEFAKELELPIVAKACKPLPFGYFRAMKCLNGNKHNTVSVGDQLLTDVLGAHLAGIAAYMVMPLVEVDLKHTVALRVIERGLLGSREPESVPVLMNSVIGEDMVLDRQSIVASIQEGNL